MSSQVSFREEIPQVVPVLVYQTSITDYFSLLEVFQKSGLRLNTDVKISSDFHVLEPELRRRKEQMLILSPPHGNVGAADEIALTMSTRYPKLNLVSMQTRNSTTPRLPYHYNINLASGEARFHALVSEIQQFLRLNRQIHSVFTQVMQR